MRGTFSPLAPGAWRCGPPQRCRRSPQRSSRPATLQAMKMRLLVPQTVQNVSAHFSAMLHMGWRDQCTKHLQMQQPAGHSEPALCPNKCHRAMLTWIAAWLHKGLGPGEEVQQLPQRCAAHSGQAPPWQRQGTITSRTRQLITIPSRFRPAWCFCAAASELLARHIRCRGGAKDCHQDPQCLQAHRKQVCGHERLLGAAWRAL